jgi:hypothetical protein
MCSLAGNGHLVQKELRVRSVASDQHLNPGRRRNVVATKIEIIGPR